MSIEYTLYLQLASISQVLIYPHVSARGDRHLNSFQEYKDGPLLDTKLIDWLVSWLVGWLVGWFVG